MNPHTGAIYNSRDEAVTTFDEFPADIVEVSGPPDAVVEAAEALEARAKSLGVHKPGSIPSARELRRQLGRMTKES